MESILGLEFTQDKIKILEIRAAERASEILRLDKIDLTPESTKEGIISEPKLVAERILKFLRENNISTKKAIALINPAYTFTRIIRIPHNLSDGQMRLNLEAELNQYQAFANKDTIIDFKKLEEISEEGIKKVNVLFAATLRALSESYLKTVELSGLNLQDIDVSILSIMRLLDEIDLKSSSLDVILLMLIGEKYLEMCILKGNRPRFLHSLEIDMYDFDKDRDSFINRLVSAIKLVVNFYQTRFIQGEQISRIIINPLAVKYNQIHTLLQVKLPQFPIQLINPLNKINLEKAKSLDLDELRFGFSCLLGATLRIENKNQPFNLNLLREQKTKKEFRTNQMYLLFIALSFILGTMVISLGWIVLKVHMLQNKISYYELQLKQPPQELNKAISINEKKSILEKQIAEGSSISSRLKKYFYFQNIAKAMVLVPQDLWLTEVALDNKDGILLLTGESKTEKSVFDYVSSLSSGNYFDSVELVSSLGMPEGIKFIIRCNIK